MKISDDEFEYSCDKIDVTSISRPDTNWVVFDAQNHRHEWYVGDAPAHGYNPEDHYTTPTLKWVKDGEEYWEGDDEPHDVGHYECARCGEPVNRQFTGDSNQQFVRGLARYRINGRNVSEDEFKRRLRAAGIDLP